MDINHIVIGVLVAICTLLVYIVRNLIIKNEKYCLQSRLYFVNTIRKGLSDYPFYVDFFKTGFH